MIQRKHRALSTIHLANDALASNLAMLAAYFLRFTVEVIPVTKGTQDITVYTHLLPLVTIVFPLAFSVQGLYRMRPTRSAAEEWIGVGIGALLGTVLLSGLLLWVRPGGEQVLYSRATLLIFLVCEIFLVMAGRQLVRAFVERRYRAGRGLDRVLIAGDGELARGVVQRIRSHQELGFELVGYVADSTSAEGIPSL